MKAILNLSDFILYQSYVRTLNAFGWIAKYKVEILCALIIFGLFFLALDTFGAEEITKEFEYSFSLDRL